MQPCCSSLCKAGYSALWPTCRTSLDIWRIRCAIAQPCMGWSATIFKISRSKVPCTRSVGLLTLTSVTDSSMSQQRGCVKSKEGHIDPVLSWPRVLEKSGLQKPALSDQKPNCTLRSMRRGFNTAVGWPKNGDVSTPLYPVSFEWLV